MQPKEFVFQGKNLVTEVFIETGTFRGATLEVAAAAGFQECHSIEVCPRLFEAVVPKFQGRPGVHLHLGSSPEVLTRIMDPNKHTLFWLDAHYQGYEQDEQDPKYGECPLLSELKAIVAVPWVRKPTILIDDAYIFAGRWEDSALYNAPLFDTGQWPTLADITTALPGYTITEHNLILYCLPV